jgi:presenilin-like A22 family membrane protease
MVAAQEIYLPKISLQDFFFSFLIATFFILLFVFYKKAGKFKEIIYKGLFIITCFWGGMTILNLWIPVFGSILIMGVLIALWLEFPSVWVHDVLMVLGLSGASSFFGLGFSPAVVVFLLVIFSFYDFIAVYKTKHMVAMAKDMVEKKVILGFIIPKEIKYFKDKLEKIRPNGNYLILGGGDVVFPCLLAVSVVPLGFLQALVIIIFSLAGSLLSYWIFTREKEPIPALPPIALLSIIGYLIMLLA